MRHCFSSCFSIGLMLNEFGGPLWQPISVTDQEIVEMILFPVVNEACRVLDEGIVVRASDLDIASVLGMSFPSYRWVILWLFWLWIIEGLFVLSETSWWLFPMFSVYMTNIFQSRERTKHLKEYNSECPVVIVSSTIL